VGAWKRPSSSLNPPSPRYAPLAQKLTTMGPAPNKLSLLHWNMVNAHQAFKLGYESILKNLDNPPLDDLANFIGYCEAWVLCIEDHHESEEVVVFPFLNEKMDFSGEAEQHKAIHATLDEISEMIREAKADHAKFDAEALKVKMVDFKPSLYGHLDDEVAHITSSKIEAAGFTDKDMVDMNSKLEAYAKSHADLYIAVPFMTCHTPPEEKPHWPPFPWILKKLFIPYVFARRYSGYWKYAPYASS